jgi:Zn-dependent protease/CBS domain-containing protein
MHSSLELGRIAGIRIGVNWSWLVVFTLIVWTLVSAVFPSQNPGLSHGAYLGMGIAAALLFFVSLLLHELGHAFEARREGMEIEGITLWLFGGVARFSGMFPSAGAEFRIAIAGPLVSLVLGGLFVGVAIAIHGPQEADGVAAWLGYINLTLLVFNLLPALPLDGGRVLRSAIWAVRRDFRIATLVAAGVSRAIAVLMIAGGLFLLIFESSFSGAWFAFLGWFLFQAATGEARFIAVQQALGGLRVRDVMVSEPVTVPADLTLGLFMDQVAWSRRYTTYPVVDDGRAVGLLAFRNVAEVPRSEWDTRTVRDCMIPRARVPVVTADQSAVDALAKLSESEVSRGLVLDGEGLAGLISISDLARALELGPAAQR